MNYLRRTRKRESNNAKEISKFIMDIDIDMTKCIRIQHTEDVAVNLIQQ